MRDDMEFNISFVGFVEAHPCLYDFTRPDYHMNHIQEQAWQTIAHQVGDGVSALECKNRWRNLRGNYTKCLRKHELSAVEHAHAQHRYYLSERMNFVQQFTKSRRAKAKGMTSVVTSKAFDCEDRIKSEDTGISSDAKEDYDDSTTDDTHDDNVVPAKKSKRRKLSNSRISLNKSVAEYLQGKTKVECHLTTNEDADKHFLLSLVPDLRKMTDRQKRKFKVAVLNLSQEILEEPTADSFVPVQALELLYGGDSTADNADRIMKPGIHKQLTE